MKKATLLLATLLAGASLSAQEPASSYSVTVDFPYATKYVFRGYELAKGAFQPSVKVTSGDFYAGVWMSAPVDRGYELEIDYFAGYGFKLAEAWSLDTGLTVYTYPGLDTSGGADKATFEGYLGVNGTVGVFTTGTYAYYDMTLEVLTLQEVLGYSITLDDKTSVNLSATLGHVVPNGGGGYTYYGFGMAVPYKLSDKATVTAGVQYADHDIDGTEGSHFWGTLGFTYAF
jgi:uncharacterized protein (TIGR02001 family)